MAIKDFQFFARIKKIEFINFRNIERGCIEFPNSKSQDFINESPSVLGLYGQNGSGKTSVIMALGILKDVLSGKSIENKYQSSIRYGCNKCTLVFTFSMYSKFINSDGEAMLNTNENSCYDVFYQFDIAKNISEKSEDEIAEESPYSLRIENEVLKYRITTTDGKKIIKKQTIIDTNESNSQLHYYPFGNFEKSQYLTAFEPSTSIRFLESLAISLSNSQSFIFSPKTINLLRKSILTLFDNFIDKALFERVEEVIENPIDFGQQIKELYESSSIPDEKKYDYFRVSCFAGIPVYLIRSLSLFGRAYLHVIDTATTGQTNINTELPLLLWYHDLEQGVFNYKVSLKMDGLTHVPEKSFIPVKKSLDAVSDVLAKIVPDVRLNIVDYGIRLNKDGKEEHYFELSSQRNDTIIPLRYESDGIRRIVSILSLLIATYNDRSFTIAIDEIDSGIFEFLLGEILSIMSESVKGQLIFTSHNLRPLEVLPSKFLCFTTTDPKNRFTKINTRGNSNLRDTYFRSIVLNTLKTPIYNPTDKYEIELAFYRAGHGGMAE